MVTPRRIERKWCRIKCAHELRERSQRADYMRFEPRDEHVTNVQLLKMHHVVGVVLYCMKTDEHAQLYLGEIELGVSQQCSR